MGLPEKQPEPPAHSRDWADFANREKSPAPTGAEQTQRREWMYEDDRHRVWPLGDHDPNTDVTVRAQAFRAVFDGRSIVPAEPVDLPVGLPVVLVFAPVPAALDEKEQLDDNGMRRREEARSRLAELLKDMPHIPLEAIKTEL